jgi:hypothetical protein
VLRAADGGICRGPRPLRILDALPEIEHLVVLILTGLIAIVIAFAVWNLMLKIGLSILVSGSFDPTDYSVFQAIFGMIFTSSSRWSSSNPCWCWQSVGTTWCRSAA